jgi:ribosome-binding factor A
MATKHSKAIPNRNLRIASQIARDLAELIPREVHDPRALLITITDVELTPDYAHAKIYFTTLNEDGEAAREALQAKAGWLHSLLFKRLSIHTVPMLHFVHDRSVRDGAALSQLIDQANASRAAD